MWALNLVKNNHASLCLLCHLDPSHLPLLSCSAWPYGKSCTLYLLICVGVLSSEYQHLAKGQSSQMHFLLAPWYCSLLRKWRTRLNRRGLLLVSGRVAIIWQQIISQPQLLLLEPSTSSWPWSAHEAVRWGPSGFIFQLRSLISGKRFVEAAQNTTA
jgi:hypothetical protein